MKKFRIEIQVEDYAIEEFKEMLQRILPLSLKELNSIKIEEYQMSVKQAADELFNDNN